MKKTEIINENLFNYLFKNILQYSWKTIKIKI